MARFRNLFNELGGIIFSIALLPMTVLIAVEFNSLAVDSMEWVAHSETVAGTIDRLKAAVADAETVARDYGHSSDPDFLTSYNAMYAQILEHSLSLQKLVQDNPAQFQKAVQLHLDLTAYLDSIRTQLIDGETSSEHVKAFALSPERARKHASINAQLNDMSGVERAALTSRWQQSHAMTAYCIAAVIAGVLLSTILLIFLTLRHRRMQKSMEKSEARMRGILEGVVDGIITINEHGIIQSWNKAATDMFGYEASYAIGQNIKIIMPEGVAKEHDGYLANYLKTGNAKIIGIGREVEGRRKDGSLFPLDLSISESGSMERTFTGVVRDITGRKQAEAELRDSEYRFRAMFETAALGIAQVAVDGTFIRLNEKYCQILGYASSELEGLSFQDVTDPEDFPEDQRNVNAILEGKIPNYTMDKRYIRKNGSTVWVSLTVTLMRDAKGIPLYFMAAAKDITLRKNVESELRRLTAELEQRVAERTSSLERQILETRKAGDLLEQKEKQLRLVTDVLPAGVLYIDSEHHYRFCNTLYASWLNREPSSIVNQPIAAIGDQILTGEFLDRVLSGQSTRFDALFEQNQQQRHLQVDAVPDMVDGRVRGCVILLSDISARVAIEADMAAARQAADSASQAKSMFVATMSHEIRTPIGVILGSADRLLGSDVTAEQRLRMAETIRRNGQNLLAIVNDILDLSKVEQGKFEIEPSLFELPIFLTEVIAQMRIKAEEKGLTVSWQNRGPIPLMIRTDRVRLRQILFNLMGNAIKFTQSGSIEVSVGLSKWQGQTHLHFLVTDTGIGIQPEHQAKLFTPFTQAEASITRTFGGTGLGLSLSRQFAQLLGGQLELLESRPGKGSTFELTIGIDLLESETLVSERELGDLQRRHEESQRRERSTRIDLGGCRILLAEDFEDNQELLRSFLEEAGAAVDIAEDGHYAAEKAFAAPYDVILMDMQMPHVNGYEASSLIRSHGIKTPIIALTAHAMRGEMEKCLAAGCTDFLSKPIERLDLLKAVRAYLKPIKGSDGPLEKQHSIQPLFSRHRENPAIARALTAFVNKLPSRIEQFKHMYEAKDQNGIRRLAHQLRGAGGGYGFPEITRYAEIIEGMAHLDQKMADSINMLELICKRVAVAHGSHGKGNSTSPH